MTGTFIAVVLIFVLYMGIQSNLNLKHSANIELTRIDKDLEKVYRKNEIESLFDRETVPGTFLGAYDYDNYFIENEDGLWSLKMPEFIEKQIDKSFLHKTIGYAWTEIPFLQKIIRLSAIYDAKTYLLNCNEAHYRNVFVQDFLKEAYDNAFMDELDKGVAAKAKSDAKSGNMNRKFLEDSLTSVSYKKVFMEEKAKHQVRNQAASDNKEALSQLLAQKEPELSSTSADEFEIIFADNNNNKNDKFAN